MSRFECLQNNKRTVTDAVRYRQCGARAVRKGRGSKYNNDNNNNC